MNKKILIVGSGVLLLTLWFWFVWKSAQEMDKYSAMSSLMMEIKRAQDVHYAAHQRYAAHLADLLTQNFSYNDNGKPEMLNQFAYKVAPDGRQFTLSWQGRYARKMTVNRGQVTLERMTTSSD